MKIRNGFVSNSSSSSFTCDVCGNTESGIDMSYSEAGMFECENGHTCCESHQIETNIVPTEEKRKKLMENVESQDYYKTRPREKAVELDEIANYDEDEVNDKYDSLCDDGHPAAECPICSFIKPDVGLMYQYLLKKNGVTPEALLAEVGAKYNGNYVEFRKDVLGK